MEDIKPMKTSEFFSCYTIFCGGLAAISLIVSLVLSSYENELSVIFLFVFGFFFLNVFVGLAFSLLSTAGEKVEEVANTKEGKKIKKKLWERLERELSDDPEGIYEDEKKRK